MVKDFILMIIYPLRILLLFILFTAFGKPYIYSIELSIMYVAWVLMGYVFALCQKRKQCKIINSKDKTYDLSNEVKKFYNLYFVQFLLFVIFGIMYYWEVIVGYIIAILIFPFLPLVYETYRIKT